MEYLTDLKAILHSKRANVFYLEKCRVMAKDGRVVFLTKEKDSFNFWNIPIANTIVLLLGTGTSITQAAVRLLAAAGVVIGFTGSRSTPLLMGTEIEWLCPQSEYRPTEYVQGWVKFWFNEEDRLNAGKYFQKKRISFINKIWEYDREIREYVRNPELLGHATKNFFKDIDNSNNSEELLRAEAIFTKRIYKIAAAATGIDNFVRDRDSIDLANIYLNHGNYLAYGLGAAVLWVLGIPYGLAVIHGKTRRGALVFDVADLIKDAIVLPLAFMCSQVDYGEQYFRSRCMELFIKHKAMEFMFETVKLVASHDYFSGGPLP